MAKIGTAHVEIKPVLNEDALREISDRINAAVNDAASLQVLVAGVRLYDAMFHADVEWLGAAPVAVLEAYGRMQDTLDDTP